MPPPVTAIIVTYHSACVIERCLESLRGIPAVVIDNASSDGTAEIAERFGATVLRNATNRGFSAAVNRGVRACKSPYLLLLNPDAALATAWEPLLSAADRHGLAAGQLLGSDGKPQEGFSVRRFPTAWTLAFEVLGINRLWRGNPVNWRYRYGDLDWDQPGLVEQPAGAFLLFRRDVWETVGGLDESYFPVWFEDVDFCLRARVMGFPAEYVPQVQALHQGGHSLRVVKEGCRILYWYGSLLRYAGKHFRRWAFRGVCLAVMLAAVLRLVWEVVRSRDTATVLAYCKVFQLAGKCLFSPEYWRPLVSPPGRETA